MVSNGLTTSNSEPRSTIYNHFKPVSISSDPCLLWLWLWWCVSNRSHTVDGCYRTFAGKPAIGLMVEPRFFLFFFREGWDFPQLQSNILNRSSYNLAINGFSTCWLLSSRALRDRLYIRSVIPEHGWLVVLWFRLRLVGDQLIQIALYPPVALMWMVGFDSHLSELWLPVKPRAWTTCTVCWLCKNCDSTIST